MSRPEPMSTEGRRSPGRHTAGQRAMLAVNVIVIIACFAGAAGLLLAKRVRESITAAPQVSIATGGNAVTVGSDGVFVGDPSVTFPEADPQAQNFLVVGDDGNACIDPDSPWASAADPAREDLGQRSDTIMVVRIDPETERAAILSFPRDLWVKIPGKGKSRINSTYRDGDYSLMAQTLFDNFGVQVDHYVQVDFCAFKTIVEAVGGVKVPFEFPARDDHINLHIDAVGCHTFGGDEALAYVRSRYYEYLDTDGRWKSDNAYDLGRVSRQQDFLRRLLAAAASKGVFNASVASSLLDTLTKYVVVDQNLTIDGMLQFLGVLQHVQAEGVPTYQIEAKRLIVQNNDVLDAQLDTENMAAILAIFRGQTALAAAPGVTDPTGATVPSGTVAAAETTVVATTVAATAPPVVAPVETGETSVPAAVVEAPAQDGKGVVPPSDVSC